MGLDQSIRSPHSHTNSTAVASLWFNLNLSLRCVVYIWKVKCRVQFPKRAHINDGENGETRSSSSSSSSVDQPVASVFWRTRHDGPSSGAALSSSVSVQLQLCVELQMDKTQVPAPPRSLSGSDQKDGEFDVSFLFTILILIFKFELLLIERIFVLKILQF